jgi:hypothetical protein
MTMVCRRVLGLKALPALVPETVPEPTELERLA